jgi:hypothetical protein
MLLQYYYYSYFNPKPRFLCTWFLWFSGDRQSAGILAEITDSDRDHCRGAAKSDAHHTFVYFQDDGYGYGYDDEQ